MSIISSLNQRRSYYKITKELPTNEQTLLETIKQVTELVPDAFNMKSSRLVIVMKEQQDILWDTIDKAFKGLVPKDKIAGFAQGAGTILYYIDDEVVASLQKRFPLYADNFPGWALQSSGMLQISLWTALRELKIGASLQHYNPVIDESLRKLYQLPQSYRLVAQMPFGGIAEEPLPKAKEDIALRVRLEA